MAKGRSNRSQRDNNSIANDVVSLLRGGPTLDSFNEPGFSRLELPEVSDGRLWSPGVSIARQFDGRGARVTVDAGPFRFGGGLS